MNAAGALTGLPVLSQLVVGAGFMVFGLAFFTWSRRAAARAEESASWPSVVGTVLSTSARSDGDLYYPAVTYEYEFGGRRHTGSRLAIFERGFTFRSSAEAAASRFATGQRVTVFVNPSAPSEAVLRPGPRPAIAAAFQVAGVVMAGFGLFLLAEALGRL